MRPCLCSCAIRGPAGPPLAVKRLAAHFPQTVELSSADAMLAGHGMQVGQDVEIVARLSGSGGPLPAPAIRSAQWRIMSQPRALSTLSSID